MLNKHNGKSFVSLDVSQMAQSFSLSTKDDLPQRNMTEVKILSVRDGVALTRADYLAPEEPLEIRVKGPDQEPLSVAVTMRTPGHDRELAVGFLYTEGLIRSRDEVVSVEADTVLWNGQPCNTATVTLSRLFDLGPLKRNFYATSSCGICGKASLEQIAVHCEPVAAGSVLPGSLLVQLPHTLRQAQAMFEQTGGLHATGLFDLSGRLLVLREDVGRHNAVDKVIGCMVLERNIPLSDRVLMVSGRLSFEIMQKAAVAGTPIICAVSAPSSLAVAIAHRFRLTLVGFLREQSFNIYTHPERIALDR